MIPRPGWTFGGHFSKWRKSRRPPPIAKEANLRRDQRGVAAVEFALILPLMLVIYFGLVQMSRAIRTVQKINQMSRTVVDLVGRKLDGGSDVGQAGLTDSDVNAIRNAAAALLAPLPSANLSVVISEVLISKPSGSGAYLAKVQWTYGWGDDAASMLRLPCSATLAASDDYSKSNIRTELIDDATSDYYVLVADISYDYSPGVNFAAFKWKRAPSYTIRRTNYAPLRNTYEPPHIQYKVTTAGGRNCNGVGL